MRFFRDDPSPSAMVPTIGWRWWLPLLAVSAVPALTGCELVRGCTAEFVFGITVEVRPGFIELPARGAVLGFVRDGAYVDSLRVLYTVPTEDSLTTVVLGAAGERPGVYDVSVRRAGFLPWDTVGVRVRDDGCHPVGVQLQVTLRPVP